MTMNTNSDKRIQAMLDAAGLTPSSEERAAIVRLYDTFQPGVDALYALPEARYESPALVFQAAPKLTPW